MKRADVLLICVLLCAALLLWMPGLLARGGTYAVILVNGEQFARIRLDGAATPYTLQPTQGVTLTVYGDGIAFTQADCPNGYCMASGRLLRVGDCALCLPAKTAVILRGFDPDAPDAVTY